ncbi:MAG: PDZ domain-containing protein [Propionibacteriaceae bacterium]
MAVIQSGTETSAVQIGPTAAGAGVTAGDTITKLGSTTISVTGDLSSALAQLEPGEHVNITWITIDGERRSATVTLGASSVN